MVSSTTPRLSAKRPPRTKAACRVSSPQRPRSRSAATRSATSRPPPSASRRGQSLRTTSAIWRARPSIRCRRRRAWHAAMPRRTHRARAQGRSARRETRR
eukprot:Amastigsp_a88_574.p6 type:complete len:100 gc:universal Amastigsp_a88_574:740-441(-)